MTENIRKSFIFYESYFEAISELPEKDRLKIYEAIAKLSLRDEEDNNLSGISKAIFIAIKPQILANNERYDNGKKGAEHGSKGGRPKKETPYIENLYEEKNPDGVIEEENNKNPIGVNGKDKPKTPNENDNDNVNENKKEIKKEKPIKIKLEEIAKNDFEKLFDYWEQNKNGGKYKTEESRNLMFNNLKKLTNDDFSYALEAIKFAVGNNYQGFCNGGELFYKPPKNNQSMAKTEASKIAEFNKQQVL